MCPKAQFRMFRKERKKECTGTRKQRWLNGLQHGFVLSSAFSLLRREGGRWAPLEFTCWDNVTWNQTQPANPSMQAADWFISVRHCWGQLLYWKIGVPFWDGFYSFYARKQADWFFSSKVTDCRAFCMILCKRGVRHRVHTHEAAPVTSAHGALGCPWKGPRLPVHSHRETQVIHLVQVLPGCVVCTGR